MEFSICRTKQESLAQLKVLVASFADRYDDLKRPEANETILRTDFLNPLLKTFGWDVENNAGHSNYLRDVLQEESIDVDKEEGGTKKNPDYTLRVNGIRQLFVEAKKAAVDITKSSSSCFQIRRYGWNANLAISVLSNFENLAVYDCRHKPDASDVPHVSRHKLFHFSDFIERFDELYELLSYESVSAGFFDNTFPLSSPDLSTFDDYFLQQIETWRERLGRDILANNPKLDNSKINFLVQRLLNRIIFLRICEDRGIEADKTLQGIKSYDQLKNLFKESDKKYNSGLFDFIEDQLSMGITLTSETLISVFDELYYPQSPYDFSVVDSGILSQIYERWLGSRIEIGTDGKFDIALEPEAAASNGIVPTPKSIVQFIVRETLEPLLSGKTQEQIAGLRISDICCGSGSFLLAAWDYLLQKYAGNEVMDLKTKQWLMKATIYGVDINPYAVEVTKFSLYLKLLENETIASVKTTITGRIQLLPSLDENIKNGNSLIDERYFEYNPDSLKNYDFLHLLKPFNWKDEFPFLVKTGGFDAILGNPPYIRIQNMKTFQREQVEYFQKTASGFETGNKGSIDKYYFFIERAIWLLNTNGTLGYIIPNKFMIVKSGALLRKFIKTNSSLCKIIHFGVQQVFPGRSTYSAILIVDKKQRDHFKFKRVQNIPVEMTATESDYDSYEAALFTEQPWIFLPTAVREIFKKVISAGTKPLHEIAEVTVGMQTSKDKVYIFTVLEETATTYKFAEDGEVLEIEKAICQPALYDLSWELLDTVKGNAQMIFPYHIENDKAILYSEQELESQFPLAWSYLNRFKEELSARSINGNNPKWYQYGRSQGLTKFHDANKLIWPVLSTRTAYVYDENNLKFTGGGNGPYYSLLNTAPYSLLYIAAILSHPLFEAMVKAGASEFRGEYYSHGKQFIESLPIKTIDFANKSEKSQHDEIVSAVEEIIHTKKQIADEPLQDKRRSLTAKLVHVTKHCETLVNKLYGITIDELQIVSDSSLLLAATNED